MTEFETILIMFVLCDFAKAANANNEEKNKYRKLKSNIEYKIV